MPGKSPKPPPVIHRRYLRRCLQRGVQWHDPVLAEGLAACAFVLAAWNFRYYGRYEPLNDDVPWIERLIESQGPDEADIEQARHWSKWLTRLMYALGDRVSWLAKWLPDPRVRHMIEDTLRYFHNTDGIADSIRDIVKREIRAAGAPGAPVCLIAHSMGTVIAYEALWQLTHEDRAPVDIDLFLTLGSPLGMNYVQHRLLGLGRGDASYPAGIRRWVNISAVGDLVSVDETVADDFAPMVAQGLVDGIEDIHGDVYTGFRNRDGLNPHRSYGYLVHPKVGGVIARWCRTSR